MKTDILLGLQWGDEGKGKAVDYLTPAYDVIARFQGGPNAGHSLEFNQVKHVLHTIPSGIFHAGKLNIIGNGVVIDPIIFQSEIDGLKPHGVDFSKLLISKKAHLILPTHRLLDAAMEAAKGKSKIGSTLKGIGPTYTDKTARHGLRVGDIFLPTFQARYERLLEKHAASLKQLGYTGDIRADEARWMEAVAFMRQFRCIDSEYEINALLDAGRSVLAEGAQGTMLDVDFGSYPFVTSSNTICAGACTGLGLAPSRIGKVYGIVKAYCTRVGSGPFPTELFDATGDELRNKGGEFGATTGRPRRCGWLDIPALKYSVMVNGVTSMIMTKPDVLSGFDTIKVCTSYMVNGVETDRIPYDVEAVVEPVYTEFPGWKEDISKVRSYDDLPKALRDYVQFIEKAVGVPFEIVSVGPDRTATLVKA
ncbi:MAG: adenylosuccinate synthase [Bacteroidales bacterium]|nr:adenylosuccinate synthase [Bacteroidales bacterium]MCR5714782.1 adenylosuccinate synthase [Bacteroidales bacterium]